MPTEPVVTPPPAATPTIGPQPTSTPGIARRYRVHPGDTLAAIAAKFGVTRKQILAVNDLGDPPQLRFGVFINIPFP
jgi:LysM repeat protein